MENEKKKASARKITYNNSYNRENYDEIKVMVKRGEREKIKAHAAARGESVNAFIDRAIVGQIQRDSGDPDAVEDSGD